MRFCLLVSLPYSVCCYFQIHAVNEAAIRQFSSARNYNVSYRIDRIASYRILERYLSNGDGKVHLDDLDLEQVVQSLEDPHLDEVVTTCQSLEQHQTLLEHRLKTAVLLLLLRK